MNAIHYARSVAPDRQAWRDSMPQRCMACREPRDWLPLEVHEIERKSAASRRWGVRANYLLICNRCHQGPLDSMPHAQQLCIKMLADPENFSLEAWLRIADPELKAPNRITLSDIVQYAKLKGAA